MRNSCIFISSRKSTSSWQ